MNEKLKVPQDEDIASMLRNSVQDFVARRQDLKGFRARMGGSPAYDAGVFEQMHALGWRALLVGQDAGGSGLGLREAAHVMEELGQGLLGDPLVATAVLPVCVLSFPGAEPVAQSLLQGIAKEGRCLVLSWQERADSIDVTPRRMSARPDSAGGWVLNGTHSFVVGGEAADDFLVSARTDDGVGVFLVSARAQGLTRVRQPQIDGSGCLSLQLRGVALAREALVVGPRQGGRALTRALDIGIVAVCAELMGVMRAAFETTLAYMRTRVQFNQPIGSFQALQHKAVDLLVQRELAAAVLDEAVGVLSRDGIDEVRASQIASRAKARCSDAALRITRECIQLHGAIGYTHECDIGLYLKRALVLAAWLGNASQHRRRHVALEGLRAP